MSNDIKLLALASDHMVQLVGSNCETEGWLLCLKVWYLCSYRNVIWCDDCHWCWIFFCLRPCHECINYRGWQHL